MERDRPQRVTVEEGRLLYLCRKKKKKKKHHYQIGEVKTGTREVKGSKSRELGERRASRSPFEKRKKTPGALYARQSASQDRDALPLSQRVEAQIKKPRREIRWSTSKASGKREHKNSTKYRKGGGCTTRNYRILSHNNIRVKG